MRTFSTTSTHSANFANSANSTRSARSAFTLIELLVAMTVFLMIMAMVGNIYQRCTAVSEKTLAVLDLHQRANAYSDAFETDFSSILSSCAMNFDISDDDEDSTIANFIFMRATQGGYSRFHPRREDQQRKTDIQWVCWHWDHQTGEVYRAKSRTVGGNWFDKFNAYESINQGWSFNTNHISPTGQRYFRNFIGKIGGIGICENISAEKVQLYRGFERDDSHPQKALLIEKLDADGDGEIDGYNANYWRTLHFNVAYKHEDSDTKQLMREDFFFGTDELLENAFAVANRDGRTYNKDFVNILGNAVTDDGAITFPSNITSNGGSTIEYPHQMEIIGSGLEFFTISPVKADGETIIDGSDDQDADVPGITIDGAALDAGSYHDRRPRFIHLFYVLHDMPHDLYDIEDLDGDGDSDESLIQACRDTAVKNCSIGNFHESARDRRHEFMRLVKKENFYAFEFQQVITLTR
ncbi:MAG: prepilin-type N-terminal cleavage/methylation domain-containing protein [Planctomycetes bacterium]|nr:prepilin-type N-terminal cleavage/methylation domain-containing protein [Planctomycetota bacterium]